MVGTGVFSTPGSILSGLGSVGLSLVYWVLGLIIAMAGLLVYLELASYFPNRSGGEVVYLEQGWPRPKYFLPTAFAAFKVIFSFGSSNAIGLNFRNSFDGTTNDAYGITNALVRINFAYSGWENCFNVVAEIKASSILPGRPTRVDVGVETDQDRAVGWSSVHRHRRSALHVGEYCILRCA
ncbi:high affinity methionine permease [Diplocarpon rosae]|nr:high affinity methionine permease [Diplocarpon rosae]